MATRRQTAYVETTIPSYLVAKPSKNLVIAAHQDITRRWWKNARDNFELIVSQAVIDEIGAGSPYYAARRSNLLDGLPILALTKRVEALAEVYASKLAVPK